MPVAGLFISAILLSLSIFLWLIGLGASAPGLTSPAAAAASCAAAGLRISSAEIRASAPGAPVSGGYMLIANEGSQPQRLVSVSAPFSGRTELHDMKMDKGVMKMFELHQGVTVPAGQQLIFRPGGRHIMFMELDRQLRDGERYRLALVFDDCGTIEQLFAVTRMPGRGHNHSDDDETNDDETNDGTGHAKDAHAHGH